MVGQGLQGGVLLIITAATLYTVSQAQQPLAGGQPHLGLVLLLRGRQEAGRQQGVVLAVVLRGRQQGQRVVVRRRPGQHYIRYF